jgi:hypothetical protein
MQVSSFASTSTSSSVSSVVGVLVLVLGGAVTIILHVDTTTVSCQ